VKDLYSHIDVRRALSPVSVADNTPLVSQIIDRQAFESLTFPIAIGSVADADATFTVLVEHGEVSNLSDAAAVADEELLGTEAGASFQFDSDNGVRKIGYVGGRRYVRLTITPAGNASAAVVSALAILGHPARLPVA
jgi:hypothetical protein